MRAAAIIREAWRNVVTGTTHVAWLTVILTIVTSGLVGADLVAIRALENEATTYQASGAAIVTLSAPGRIDPVACDKLGAIAGVQAAGAIRAGRDNIRTAALPSSTVPTYDVTAGFPLLSRAAAKPGGGVFLSDQAAAALTLHVGEELALRQGSTRVAGVYEYPADGRRPGFGYAALIPTIDTSGFDECWVESWPVAPQIPHLLQLTVLAGGGDAQSPVLSQLNTTLGSHFDGADRFRSRITRFAPLAALLVGIGLGFLAVRVRRVQHASALHAGVAKTDLGVMIFLEALAWTVPALIISGAVAIYLAMFDAGGDQWANFRIGSAGVLSGVLGPFLGGALGLVLTREKHLFRYFKTR